MGQHRPFLQKRVAAAAAVVAAVMVLPTCAEVRRKTAEAAEVEERAAGRLPPAERACLEVTVGRVGLLVRTPETDQSPVAVAVVAAYPSIRAPAAVESAR